ncbi:hypothetical protein BDV09DRAFT_164885 [Aspergillus tetrazonus]
MGEVNAPLSLVCWAASTALSSLLPLPKPHLYPATLPSTEVHSRFRTIAVTQICHCSVHKSPEWIGHEDETKKGTLRCSMVGNSEAPWFAADRQLRFNCANQAIVRDVESAYTSAWLSRLYHPWI